jgi:hypothetical protein
MSASELVLYLVVLGETEERGDPAVRQLTDVGMVSAQIAAAKLWALAKQHPIRLMVNPLAPACFEQMAAEIVDHSMRPKRERPRIVRRPVQIPPGENDYMALIQLSQRGIVAVITSVENLYGNIMPIDPNALLTRGLFEPGSVVKLTIQYEAERPGVWRTVSRVFELPVVGGS